MAETLKRTKRTPATEMALKSFDREIDEAIAGRPQYPNGTVYMPSDVEWLDQSLRQAALDRKPVVVVYPDGHETFLRPGVSGVRGLTSRLRNALPALVHRLRTL